MLGLLMSYSEKLMKICSEKLPNPVASLTVTADDGTEHSKMEHSQRELHYVIEEITVHAL